MAREWLVALLDGLDSGSIGRPAATRAGVILDGTGVSSRPSRSLRLAPTRIRCARLHFRLWQETLGAALLRFRVGPDFQSPPFLGAHFVTN